MLEYITLENVIVAVLILGAFAWILGKDGLRYLRSLPKETISPSNPSKKNVRLLDEHGSILLEYKDVYVTHWDTNVYLFSKEIDGKSFAKIDKGENMLVVIENIDINTQAIEQRA